MNKTAERRRSYLLRKLTEMIDRIATVRVLVILTLLSALFPAVLFPAAGIGDHKPLDLYLSYSPDQAYDYLRGLGENGRIAYARMALTTDLLFPVVYSLTLTVALAIAVRRVLPPYSRLQDLRFLPFLIVLADWCENLSLAVVIHAFPDRLDAIATAASAFTSLKWALLILAVITLLIVAALAFIKQFRDSKNN